MIALFNEIFYRPIFNALIFIYAGTSDRVIVEPLAGGRPLQERRKDHLLAH